MQRAQAATPGPVKGMPRISSSSCTVPSSPPRPCMATKATSGRSAVQPLDQVAAGVDRDHLVPEPLQRVLDPGAGAQRDAPLQRPPALQDGDLHADPRRLAERQDVPALALPPAREPAPPAPARRPCSPCQGVVQLDLLGDHLADPADALADLVLADAGEVEPHRAAAAALVDVGGLAGDEGDVLAQRLGQQVAGVDVLGQGRPDEEAAFGLGPGRLRREVLAQRLDHRVAAAAVDLDQAVDVLAPAPFGEVLADEVLGQGRGAEVGGLLAEDDLLHHRRRRHRPAEPDAGGEDLREGADVDDEVAAVELVERRQRLAAEAQQAVGVVLDDEQLAPPRQLDQAPPPLERHRHPGGVLEARHRVDEFRPPPLAVEPRQHRFQLVDPHPVLVAVDLDRLGLVAAEDRHRAGVGRRLADDDVAGIDQRLADQVDRLLAAGGDDHVVGVGQHPLGAHHLDDAVDRLGEALGRPVLERLGGRLLRDPRHLRGEGLGREGRGVGQAAGQRDHLGPRRDRHQVAHRRGAHHAGARGEEAGVALQVAAAGVGAPPVGRLFHPWSVGFRRELPRRQPGSSSASASRSGCSPAPPARTARPAAG